MDRKLKRRLVAGAVDENLRVLRNQPAGRLYRRRPWLRTLALPLVTLAVAAGFTLVARRSPAPPPAPPPIAAAALTPLAAGGPTAGLEVAPVRVSTRVFPLAVRRVVVDPGHGGGDLGTRTPTGLAEKELTLDLGRRLAARLRAGGFEPSLTRQGDERVSLADRARFANIAGADLFVSIHVNWFEDGRLNRGIETFFLGPSDDPWVTRLAQTENRNSGYSLADTRRLLESIYADLRQEQSRALAAAVQRELLASVRAVAPEVRDRGVKSAPFLVLVASEMPAILAEVACLSNDEEARLLGRPEYREQIATALFDGIAAYSKAVQQSEAEPRRVSR